MPNSLGKIISLIKKTGDNCIVLDYEGNPAYVVVTFDDYQGMILGRSEVAGLTENELLPLGEQPRKPRIWIIGRRLKALLKELKGLFPIQSYRKKIKNR